MSAPLEVEPPELEEALRQRDHWRRAYSGVDHVCRPMRGGCIRKVRSGFISYPLRSAVRWSSPCKAFGRDTAGAWAGPAWRGTARPGRAGLGWAWQGKARQSEARQGKARILMMLCFIATEADDRNGEAEVILFFQKLIMDAAYLTFLLAVVIIGAWWLWQLELDNLLATRAHIASLPDAAIAMELVFLAGRSAEIFVSGDGSPSAGLPHDRLSGGPCLGSVRRGSTEREGELVWRLPRVSSGCPRIGSFGCSVAGSLPSRSCTSPGGDLVAGSGSDDREMPQNRPNRNRILRHSSRKGRSARPGAGADREQRRR